MPNITNYSPLIQSMFGRKGASWRAGATLPGVFQFSQLNSSSIQSQLKAAGIDTNSKRYKAVIEQMKKTGFRRICQKPSVILKKLPLRKTLMMPGCYPLYMFFTNW